MANLKHAPPARRGFTIVELLTVVVILGVLAAVAVPAFIGARAGADDSAAISDVVNAFTAAKMYRTLNTPQSFGPQANLVASLEAHEDRWAPVQVLTGVGQSPDAARLGVYVYGAGRDVYLARASASGTLVSVREEDGVPCWTGVPGKPTCGAPAASAPSVTGAPTISGTVQTGQVLSVSDGTWSESPTSYAYQWQVSDDGASGWTSATGAGATTSAYTISAADAGKYLRARVSATNAAGTTVTFSAVTVVVAQAFYSLAFDGNGDWVDLGPDPSRANTGEATGSGDTAKRTMEAWIRVPVSIPTAGTIMARQRNGTGGFYFRYRASGRLSLGIENGASWYEETTIATVNDNTWHHVAATWDPIADTIDLYIDGIRQTDTAESSHGFINNIGYNDAYYVPVTLGAWAFGAGYADPFVGNIAMARYSYGVRYSGASVAVPSIPLGADGTTIGLWRMTEGTGGSVTPTAGSLMSDPGGLGGDTSWSSAFPG